MLSFENRAPEETWEILGQKETNIPNNKGQCEDLKVRERDQERCDQEEIHQIRESLTRSIPDNTSWIKPRIYIEETHIINERKYIVRYVPKDKIAPAYWYCHYNDGLIEVREDLSETVKRFVRSHELYHAGDSSDLWGWIWREARANIIPGLKDPIGLISTIWHSLTDKDRIHFYMKRFREGR